MAEQNIVNWGSARAGWGKITVDASGNDVLGPLTMFTGTRQINFTPNGELVPVYADGTIIYVGKANTGYNGTMEVTVLNDEFKKWALSEEIDSNNVQYEIAESTVNRFYLVWEWINDKKNTRHIMYNVTANRPEMASMTMGDGGSKSAQYETLPLVATPRSDGKIKANTRYDVSSTVYDSWFITPYLPTGASEYPVTVTVESGTTPIPGALVAFGDGSSAWTDTTGKVIMYKKSGTYDIFVSKTGYVAEVDSVTVASAAITKDILLSQV